MISLNSDQINDIMLRLYAVDNLVIELWNDPTDVDVLHKLHKGVKDIANVYRSKEVIAGLKHS